MKFSNTKELFRGPKEAEEDERNWRIIGNRCHWGCWAVQVSERGHAIIRFIQEFFCTEVCFVQYCYCNDMTPSSCWLPLPLCWINREKRVKDPISPRNFYSKRAVFRSPQFFRGELWNEFKVSWELYPTRRTVRLKDCLLLNCKWQSKS